MPVLHITPHTAPRLLLHNSMQSVALWGAALQAPHQQRLQLCWRCSKPVGWAESLLPLFGPQAQPRRWRRRAECQLQVTAVCLPLQQGGVPASDVGTGNGQQKRWDVVALGNLVFVHPQQRNSSVCKPHLAQHGAVYQQS